MGDPVKDHDMTQVSTVSFECRDMRHGWRNVGDAILVEKKGAVKVFSRTLECFRCQTIRVDTYQLIGHRVEKVHTKYGYTQGYQIKGGIDLAEVRWRLFKDVQMKKIEGKK